MIDLKKVKVGSELVLSAELDDPWTELKAGTKGKVVLINQPDLYGFPPVLHCVWENGAHLGVFLDDPVELVGE